MAVAISKHGIDVLYVCRNLRYTLSIFRKCPTQDSAACYHCDYARAEMSGKDATRLLNVYGHERRGL